MTLASHLRKDLSLILRDWKGLLIALALPALILLAYARMDLALIAASGRSPDAFILVISTTFSVLLVASTAMVQERRMGTLGRLSRSPANVFFLVASKPLSALVVLVPQVIVILVTAIAVLTRASIGVAEHTWPLGLLLILAGLASQTLGLLISALVSTETQAMQLTSLAFLLMFVLSGFLQPVESLGTLGSVARYLPMALGYSGAKAIIEGSGGTSQLAALLLLSLLFLLAAAAATKLRRP